MMNPTVTVFVPVYNGDVYLADSIDSILAQHFSDFELLIIDDGSSDKSVAIIESYRDDRIRLLKNGVNKGISFTRNRAIGEAKGRFLALLDADDIAFPARIGSQVDYLNTHPEIVACGSHAVVIDENGQITGEYLNVPTNIEEIKARLIFQNVFVNSTMMFRLDVLQKTKGYYDGLCEDYEMAIQLNPYYSLANIDEILVKYRMHKNNTTSIYSEQMALGEKHVFGIVHQQLEIPEDQGLISVHHSIVMGYSKHNVYPIADYERLFSTLKKANLEKKIYPNPSFNKLLFSIWYDKIREVGKRKALLLLFRKPLFAWEYVTFKMLRKVFKQTFWF